MTQQQAMERVTVKRKLAKLWSFFGGWEKPSMNPVGNGGRRLLGTVPGGWQSWQFVYHRGEFIIRIFRVFGAPWLCSLSTLEYFVTYLKTMPLAAGKNCNIPKN